MTDWKQKIEVQIAALWEIVPTRADGKGFYDDLDGSQANEIDDARQTMQALLDVAVAADQLFNELAHYGYESADSMNAMSAALVKLQEAGDG